MKTMTYTGKLVVAECSECGITYGIPEYLDQRAQEDSQVVFHCPNGHRQHYRRSEVDKLRAELDQAKADADWQRRRRNEAAARAEHERNRANGYKGALVKTKKRIGNGVCPCCQRHFANVERHMKSQHPNYLGGEVESCPSS